MIENRISNSLANGFLVNQLKSGLHCCCVAKHHVFVAGRQEKLSKKAKWFRLSHFQFKFQIDFLLPSSECSGKKIQEWQVGCSRWKLYRSAARNDLLNKKRPRAYADRLKERENCPFSAIICMRIFHFLR